MILKILFRLFSLILDTGHVYRTSFVNSVKLNSLTRCSVHHLRIACLSNKFCELGEVELFDSMFTEDCPITKQACCITKSQNTTESSLTINVIGVQTQVGGADCGLFSISMAFDLCCSIDPFTQRVDQDQIRTHLLQCFEKEEITSFPEVQRKGLDTMRRVVNSITVELYCICRGPDFPRMACCDTVFIRIVAALE